MALIDQLTGALFKYNGIRLTLTPGRPVMLSTETSERAISSKQLTNKQIDGILGGCAPPDLTATVQQPGRHEFIYNSPAGDVLVKAKRTRGGVELVITPPAAAPAAAPSLSDGLVPEPAPMNGLVPGFEPTSLSAVSTPTPTPTPAPVSTAHEPVTDDPSGYSTVPAPVARGEMLEVEYYFRKMVSNGCSDLHLSSENPPLYRKDGDIVPLEETAPLSPQHLDKILMEICPKRNQEEFKETHDSDFAYEIPGIARFRCNLFLDRNGVGGVFRQIPDKILTAEDLNLSKYILDLCHLHKGLVVVTGPTGSGKSTTLAAMIDYINRNLSTHIITIEDPIEFVHPNKRCLINQREIGVHTQGFKIALRAALREDPDIVLVGEMRDLETVAIAIETAETGHLVFGTLHTNTAPSTVDRIIDQFPTAQQAQIRTMLSESLKAVIAQTLCKKKGGGRIAALEILIVTPAISNLIREGKTFQIPSMMQTGKKVGMVTLNDSLMELVKRDLVEPHEAYYKSVDKESFKRMLERGGYSVD